VTICQPSQSVQRSAVQRRVPSVSEDHVRCNGGFDIRLEQGPIFPLAFVFMRAVEWMRYDGGGQIVRRVLSHL
jgi:hypothetical protein